MKVTRRHFFGAAAVMLGGGLLEAQSLRGRFDHRSLPRFSGGARYGESLRALDGQSDLADGAIVHVGHSTHLLSVAGARFLTDPWFFDPAFGALSHVAGPAVAPEGIGPLDAVLISHEHADHADPRALDRLDKRALAVVATPALVATARRLGFSAVEVLPPWCSVGVGAATVTAVPGLHDVYEVGYVVDGAGRSIYFAGDTRLFDDLPAVAERWPPTAALLPVDGTRLTGGALHVMNPDDAVRAAEILRARLVIPSHAEAYFSDPVAGHVLASTIAGASALFRDKMARRGGADCAVPPPGALVRVPAA